MTLEEAEAILISARREYEATATAHATATMRYHRARLAVEEMNGRSTGWDARWIRAWLAGDYEACDKLLAERKERRQ